MTKMIIRVEPRQRDERGMALALSLFALVILGALVSVSFAVTRLDHRSSDNSRNAGKAESATETGLSTLYANWDPTVQSVMPVWDGTPATEWVTNGTVAGNARVTYVDSLRRLNTELYLARSFGRTLDAAGNVLSELRGAQLFRLTKPTISVNAAITVQDPITFNGNAFLVSGTNALPPQWTAGECDPIDPTPVDDVVGVRSAVSTGVGTQDLDNVFGSPTAYAANDPTITSATFQNYLDYTYATLGSQPGVKVYPLNSTYNGIAPVLDAGGLCDKTLPGNLGEPWRNPPTAGAVTACTGYFPVVHGTGTTTHFAANNRGQGTLLIDGDLDLNGGFEWVGLIIIRGQLHISGNGNKVYGAILSEGVDVTSSGALSGDVDIHYSACAIKKAIGGATLARPLGQRSWIQGY